MTCVEGVLKVRSSHKVETGGVFLVILTAHRRFVGFPARVLYLLDVLASDQSLMNPFLRNTS
jgi:hypothetical protein